MAAIHRFKLDPIAFAVAAALSAPSAAFAQPSKPPEATLPEVVVPAPGERADGPVQGYRATRSSTFTKTDTPLREVPASITVMPGDLIYDVFKVRFDDHRTLAPETDLARADRAPSPRAGLVWIPNPVSTYYVGYSYAFLPSGEQLSLAPTTSDLAPERAKNYEIGARWDIRPKLTLSAAIFRTDRTDVKVTDPANPGSFVKSGQQRVDGVEIGLQGEIANWWSVYGGYAYMDGRVLKPITSGTTASVAAITPAGNKIGLVPENSFSLWNRFDVDRGWGAGLGLTYQSDYFTSFNDTVKVPGFWRADGAAYYALNDRSTQLALNVENLFDRKYFPTVDGDNNITPGAPRTVRLTLSTAF